MKLNEKKTTNMIFNFTKDHQFTTEIELKSDKIETLEKTKLLGVIISGLSDSDCKDIERVQRAAMRVIMGKRYEGYEESLKFMKLDSLKERREKMALKFAKKSLRQDGFSKLFPLNNPKHVMVKRNPDKYVVNKTNTQRYKKSPVPYLQRLLNNEYCEQKKDLKRLLRVNNDIVRNIPITF